MKKIEIDPADIVLAIYTVAVIAGLMVAFVLGMIVAGTL